MPQLRLNKDQMTICAKARLPIAAVAIRSLEQKDGWVFFYPVDDARCTEFSLKTLSPENFKPADSFKYDTGHVYIVRAKMNICSGGIAFKFMLNPDGQLMLVP
jgi:hypothetical protein